MATGIMMVSGLIGFFTSLFSGLLLGFSWLEALAVYCVTGFVVSIIMVVAVGIYTNTARRLA